MNTRKIGTEKEQRAAAFLTEKGMRILTRNFRCRQGEIDIIGMHDGYLVFVEVKYRRNKNCGTALEAVTFAKQDKICRVADYYRYSHRYGPDAPVRYDVLAIQGEEIRWVQNAFPHISNY